MNTVDMIPFITHEAELVRQERTNRKLWIMIMVLLAALVLTNVLWIMKVVV